MLSWLLVCVRCDLMFPCLIEKDVMFIIYFDILLIHYKMTFNTHKTQSHYTLDDVMGDSIHVHPEVTPVNSSTNNVYNTNIWEIS